MNVPIFFRNLTILIGTMLTVMSTVTIAPALPEMAEYFKHIPESIFLSKLALSLPALSIGIASLMMGSIVNRFGNRKVILTCLFIYILSGFSAFYLDSLPLILFGRVMLGFGISGLLVAFTTVLANIFEGEKLNRFLGLQSAFMGFGGVMFLVVGGLLADIGWRFPFLVYLLPVVLIPTTYFYIKDDKKNSTFNSDSTPETFPYLFYISLLASIFLGMLVFYMIPIQMPFFLKNFGDYSYTVIASIIACMSLVGSSVALFYKYFKKHLSFEMIYFILLLAMGLGVLIIGFASSLYQVIAGLMVFGFGLGLYLPNNNLWVINKISGSKRSNAIGGVIAFVSFGQFFSPIVFKPIVESDGIAYALKVGGVGMLFLAGILLCVKYYNQTKKEAEASL